MSLILDALKRAEGGKASDTELAQTYLRQSEHAPASRLRIRGGLLLGLTIGLVLVWGIDWLTKERPPSTLAPVELPTLRAPTTTAPPKAKPVLVPVTETAASLAAADREAASELNARMWADAERLQGQGNSSDLPQAEAPSRDAGSLEAQGVAAGMSVEPERSDGLTVEEAEAEIDLVALLERVAAESGEVALEPHPAVLLENLSQQAKDQIPSIVYSQHSFGSGGDSFVMLNGSTLRVGQRVGPIEVREILSDSVVLRVGSAEFRLRALNTWVNL